MLLLRRPHIAAAAEREWRHLRLLSPFTEEKTLSSPQVTSDGVSNIHRGRRGGGVVYIYKVHICKIHWNTMSAASLTLARRCVCRWSKSPGEDYSSILYFLVLVTTSGSAFVEITSGNAADGQ